ncbi:MAG: ABC transporter ATP-binding protein [Candidatus Latescibacteria bacterium]|nr:ABC transporter ATP-binding protein [Candidatus Latescibacterota bacterium]
MSITAIRTSALTRDFSNVRALDKLTIEVPEGIVFGFLGPNGSGKTTTLRLLLGLLDPTAGDAQVLGYDIRSNADEIRLRSGALLEYTGLYERLSAEENLDFYGRVWLMPSHERITRIKELLTPLDLWDHRKERVGTWSRGMKQKLAVSRALFHRPSMVFLDEPTAGLDPVAAAALRDDLAALVNREGLTVFLTTHNLAEAEKLCNQVGVINRGKLLVVGHPDELRARAGKAKVEVFGSGFTERALVALNQRPEVVTTSMNGSRLIISLTCDISIAPLVKFMVQEGIQIEEIRKGAASLEEAFLKLMEEEKK